jgi:2-iminoacetate synthase ThiH
VISTRGFEDRLQTIENVRKTNVTVCSGGIIGMGESIEDRAGMLVALSSHNLNQYQLMLWLLWRYSMEEENQLKFGKCTNGSDHKNHHARNSSAFISQENEHES